MYTISGVVYGSFMYKYRSKSTNYLLLVYFVFVKVSFFLNLAVHTQMSHIALANIYCIGMYLIPLSSYGSFINNHRKKLLIICFICILYWVKYPNLQFTHKFVTRGYDPYILEQYIIYQIVHKGH